MAKNVRELKVRAQSGYHYKEVPQIQLKGVWLREFGFKEGMPVMVKCENGRLIITTDEARAELAKAEQEFMDRELGAQKKRFEQEKKQLHVQFVAEHRATYGDSDAGEGLPMFDTNDLSVLNPQYFSIIYTDAFDVTIMSWNTGHYRFIYNPEYPTLGTCIIFHKNKASHPYHQHGRANSLRQAVRSIQSHDKWQIEGRPRRK